MITRPNIVRIERSALRQVFQMVVGIKDEDGYAIFTNFEVTRLEPGEVVPFNELFDFDEEFGRMLMDELWLAGFRPTNAPNASAEAAALQAHLGDMRAIVAKKLNVELP